MAQIIQSQKILLQRLVGWYTAVAIPGHRVSLVYWHHRNCSAVLEVSTWQLECLSSCSAALLTAQPSAVSHQWLISVHMPMVTQWEKYMDLKPMRLTLLLILDLPILRFNSEMKLVHFFFFFAFFSQSTGKNLLSQESPRNEMFLQCQMEL